MARSDAAGALAYERSERDVLRRHALAVLGDKRADAAARAAARRRLESDAAGEVDLAALDDETLALLEYAIAVGQGQRPPPAAEVARAARQLAAELDPPPPAAPCERCRGTREVLPDGLTAEQHEAIRLVAAGAVELAAAD